MRPDPVAARDAGLRRVSTVTRMLAVGGVVATGVVSAAAAYAFPGHTAKTPTNAAATQDGPAVEQPSSAPDQEPGTDDSGFAPAPDQQQQPDFQAPVAPPQPAGGGRGMVVSGGS